MFRWNTKQIARDIRTLSILITNVEIDTPGGDVDTDNLIVEIVGSDDQLYIAGFSTEPDFCDIDYENKSDVDVELIELTDGMDSRGGLNSSNNNTAQAYIAVRQYFVDKNADVVNTMKDYF